MYNKINEDTGTENTANDEIKTIPLDIAALIQNQKKFIEQKIEESDKPKYLAKQNNENSVHEPIEIVDEEIFQLRDIPDIMRQVYGWEKASKLQDLWFDAPYFAMTRDQKLAIEYEVNGKFVFKEEYYVRDENVLVDFFTVAWAYESSSLVKDALNELLHYGVQTGKSPLVSIWQLNEKALTEGKIYYNNSHDHKKSAKIFNKKTEEILKKRFSTENKYNFPAGEHDLFTVVQNRYPGNSYKLHRQIFHNMHYQHIKIGQDFVDYMSQGLKYKILSKMDEFYAAVGPSSLYTVVGKYLKEDKYVQIYSVYIYIRDTLEFMNDEGGINYNKEYQTINSGDSGKGKDADQYLGHWNQEGFLMDPLSYWGTSKNPILKTNLSSLFEKPFAFYYCVRNSTYQDWREKHNAGGDLVSFSDMVEIILSSPFTIRL